MTLAEIAVLATEALEESREALEHGNDADRATACALVSIAASLYLSSTRAPA